jgi:hypothetical protein
MSNEPKGFETTWAVVELMGHRKIAGQVSETVVGGTSIMRVDVPTSDGKASTTQFYGWQSLYCLTPVTEEIARAYSIRNQPQPVTPWELPTALPKPAGDGLGHPSEDFDGGNDQPDEDEDDGPIEGIEDGRELPY